jgi:hypothetical protein
LVRSWLTLEGRFPEDRLIEPPIRAHRLALRKYPLDSSALMVLSKANNAIAMPARFSFAA